MSGWSTIPAFAALMGGLGLVAGPSSGARAATETVIYAFGGGSDGATPSGGLINAGGTFYGTTAAGGGSGCFESTGCGTVFALAPPSTQNGPWQETVLHRFGTGSDGFQPEGHLLDLNGTLYGVTYYGGTAGYGTAFSLRPPAIAGHAWTEAVLHDFAAGRDGSHPVGGLNSVGGQLVGSTFEGGHGCAHEGCGTVFALTPPATKCGAWVETQFYSFRYASGALPQAGLIRAAGVLYGTTSEGGGDYCTASGGPGCGTVFALAPPAHSGKPWLHSVLHVFTGTDGNDPVSGLINVDGTFYGTTEEGGAHGSGTVFALAPPATPGGAWTETVIHDFAGLDGDAPYAHLIQYAGALYGTTYGGGSAGRGTAFSLTPPAVPNGAWTFNLLHSFQGGSDGATPAGNLVAVGNTLYGTTAAGGAGYGVVFAIQP